MLKMQYGLYVQNFGEYGDPHNLIALAVDAEQAGWDGFFMWDHPALSAFSHPGRGRLDRPGWDRRTD